MSEILIVTLSSATFAPAPCPPLFPYTDRFNSEESKAKSGCLSDSNLIRRCYVGVRKIDLPKSQVFFSSTIDSSILQVLVIVRSQTYHLLQDRQIIYLVIPG